MTLHKFRKSYIEEDVTEFAEEDVTESTENKPLSLVESIIFSPSYGPMILHTSPAP